MVSIHPIRTAQSWMRLNKLLLIVNTDINIYSLVSVCVYNVSSQLSGVPSGVHQQCITVHVCSFPDRNPVVRSWIWTRCHVTWGWRVPWQGTISWPSGTSRSNTAALRRAGSALAPAPASSSYSLLACLQNSLNQSRDAKCARHAAASIHPRHSWWHRQRPSPSLLQIRCLGNSHI